MPYVIGNMAPQYRRRDPEGKLLSEQDAGLQPMSSRAGHPTLQPVSPQKFHGTRNRPLLDPTSAALREDTNRSRRPLSIGKGGHNMRSAGVNEPVDTFDDVFDSSPPPSTGAKPSVQRDPYVDSVDLTESAEAGPSTTRAARIVKTRQQAVSSTRVVDRGVRSRSGNDQNDSWSKSPQKRSAANQSSDVEEVPAGHYKPSARERGRASREPDIEVEEPIEEPPKRKVMRKAPPIGRTPGEQRDQAQASTAATSKGKGKERAIGRQDSVAVATPFGTTNHTAGLPSSHLSNTAQAKISGAWLITNGQVEVGLASGNLKVACESGGKARLSYLRSGGSYDMKLSQLQPHCMVSLTKLPVQDFGNDEKLSCANTARRPCSSCASKWTTEMIRASRFVTGSTVCPPPDRGNNLT